MGLRYLLKDMLQSMHGFPLESLALLLQFQWCLLGTMPISSILNPLKSRRTLVTDFTMCRMRPCVGKRSSQVVLSTVQHALCFPLLFFLMQSEMIIYRAVWVCLFFFLYLHFYKKWMSFCFWLLRFHVNHTLLYLGISSASVRLTQEVCGRWVSLTSRYMTLLLFKVVLSLKYIWNNLK